MPIPSDENIILYNGQIHRMENQITEVIGNIENSESILCYE